jgi:hypothetical protein
MMRTHAPRWGMPAADVEQKRSDRAKPIRVRAYQFGRLISERADGILLDQCTLDKCGRFSGDGDQA